MTDKQPNRTSGLSIPGVSTPKGVASRVQDGEKAVTFTMAELDELIAKRVGAALAAANLANVRPEPASTVTLPTVAQAKEMVELDIARGLPVKGVLTTEGWYVHPQAHYVAPPASAS